MSVPITDTRRAVSSFIVVALFLGAIGSLGWSWSRIKASGASFADQQVFDRNHLGAGTLDIAIGDSSVGFAVADMAAGDTRPGRIELVNRGTLPLRFTLSASTDGGPLDELIEFAMWMSDGSTCPADPPATAAEWSPLGDLALPGGDADASRALAPGDSDLLCMLGRLPLSAPSSAQGRQLSLNFVVTAQHDLEATS